MGLDLSTAIKNNSIKIAVFFADGLYLLLRVISNHQRDRKTVSQTLKSSSLSLYINGFEENSSDGSVWVKWWAEWWHVNPTTPWWWAGTSSHDACSHTGWGCEQCTALLTLASGAPPLVSLWGSRTGSGTQYKINEVNAQCMTGNNKLKRFKILNTLLLSFVLTCNIFMFCVY